MVTMAGHRICVLLVFAAILSLGASVLLGGSPRRDKEARWFAKRHRLSHRSSQVHLVTQLKAKLSGSKAFSYPVSLTVRGRRSSDSGGQCGLPDSAVLETDPLQLTETAESMQAAWVDQDTILIVASDVKQKSKTTVWLGTPKSVGIFSFESYSDLITVPVSPDSLQVSSKSRNRVLMVSDDRKNLFVSDNGGQQWMKETLPSGWFDESQDLYMSEINPDHLFLVIDASDGSELYHSHNSGQDWKKVDSDIKLFNTAKLDSNNEFVFYMTPGRYPGMHSLHRLNVLSGDTDILDRHAYRYAVDGRYLFVTRQNITGNSDADSASRTLYVCSDYSASADKIEFNEVQLPSLAPEQLYVIMATHEAGAFIHVNLKRTASSGELYVSDSSGTRFSLSLSNHFYKVYHLDIIGWHYSVDDFYEVPSMRGVYITTAVMETSTDTTHVTVITFNNGGNWTRLRPPSNAPRYCRYPSCSLHLHLTYSQLTAKTYNLSYSATPLLSISTAVGIIIGHGSFGEVRNESEPRLVLSNDGGYTWIAPNLMPPGTYVYGIADYGNIIAVAPDTDNIEFIWFSYNRGECFVKQLLDTTEAFSLSRGLLMDPRAASLMAFVMGVEGEEEDDEWRMITLNFKGLLQRKCVPSDYHTWSEHAQSESCLLGYKQIYNLTKSSAICYNEQGYKYKPVRHSRCQCGYKDLECDYGYSRTGMDNCTKQRKYDISKKCPPGAKSYNWTKSGFRLIPGDHCQESEISRMKLATQQLPCEGHEKEAGFDNTSRKKKSYATSPGKVVGGIIIALVILATAVVAFYGFLKCREQTPSTYEKVLYQKLPTADNRFTAADEESSSDEDLIVPSPTNPFQNT